MPSRGAPWRGVGQGQKDRIGTEEVKDDTLLSEDIKDGTIKEVDLDSALQSKVNQAGGHVIENDGTPLSQRPNMNFIGAGVEATDDGETTNVTIAGGGGVNLKDLGVCDEWYVYDDMVHPTKTGVLVHWLINPNLQSETFSVPVAKGGVIRLGTNTNSGNNATNCITCAGGGATIIGGEDFLYRDRIKLLSITDNIFWTGGCAPQFPQGNNANTAVAADGGGGVVDNCVMFRYDGNLSDGPNIQCITRKGGAVNETKVDSGVAMDTSYHCYDIESDGVNVIFKIDNNVVANITTNIPTGTNLIVGEQLNSITISNSNDRKMDIDMMFIYSTTRE